MRFKISSPATADIITVGDMRAQLRIDHTEEDALIREYIKAATECIEHDAKRALISQTWLGYLDKFPAGSADIEIRKLPVSGIASVGYFDADGDSQTFDSANYYTDFASVDEPARIALVSGSSWPTVQTGRTNAVIVTFTAGYGSTASSVPAVAKQACRLLVAHWFANRETVGRVGDEIAHAYEALIGKLSWTALAGNFGG